MGLFVPERPKMPGCYVWRPLLGCPQQQTDVFDSWFELRGGRRNSTACEARAAKLDKWCGSTGTRMNFIPNVNVPPALELLLVPSSNDSLVADAIPVLQNGTAL